MQDPLAQPQPLPGSGVRVDNLWEGDAAGQTRIPVIAGWYTLSFRVVRLTAPEPRLAVQAADPIAHPYERLLPVKDAVPGQRTAVELFTNYEGQQRYTRCRLKIRSDGLEIADILFEKRRPAGSPSTYGTGTYRDTVTPPAPGELLESAAP